MDIKTIHHEIQKIDTLPTIPKTFRKMLSILENSKASLSEIGSYVSNDPVLTSRVLKIVNSAVYGFPGRISSINQAMLLLGLNVVRGLLLGISVYEAMEKTMAGLWDHSLGTAVASRIIAKKKNIEEPEEVAVAALLHDIGKVILSLKFSSEYQSAMDIAAQEKTFIFNAEEHIFGVTHAKAGAWIAAKWNFPNNLIEIIEYHNKPEFSRSVPLHTAIVHFADILVRARGIGFAGDNFVPHINPLAWERLNLSEAEIKEVFKQLEDALYETERLLHSDG
ncbi:MAG: HDOD domain-containing protein [Bacteroidetes bacterium]|nr:HDOD domain-containing protein [Bacteroidota bacterium]